MPRGYPGEGRRLANSGIVAVNKAIRRLREIETLDERLGLGLAVECKNTRILLGMGVKGLRKIEDRIGHGKSGRPRKKEE